MEEVYKKLKGDVIKTMERDIKDRSLADDEFTVRLDDLIGSLEGEELQMFDEVLKEQKLTEYNETYEIMKREEKEIFNKTGELVDKFSIDDETSINLKKNDDKYFLEYQEKGKEPYAISKDFGSKDEALKSIFKTSEYESLRDRTLFKLDKDTCIYLKDNKDNIKFNSFDIPKIKFNTESINNARRKVLLESLENNDIARKEVINNTLKKNYGFTENNLDFKTTENINSIREKIEDTFKGLKESEKLNKIKTELKNDSHAFLEGFLGFYGVELDKKLDLTNQPFEVVNTDKGNAIGKCSRKGELEIISPYYTKEEATKTLGELNEYLEKKENKLNLNEVQEVKL